MTALRDEAPAVRSAAGAAPEQSPVEDRAQTRPAWVAPVFRMAAFLLVALLVVAAHALAAGAAAARVATDGEVRLAVSAARNAGALGTLPALTPWDRLATWQLTAVGTLLPAADPVDAARWACLLFGIAAVLLVWPVLRGLGLPVGATAAGVLVVGLALPLLTLRAGITAAAPATLWLAVAGALAVRKRGGIAVVPALLAVATCPLVLAGLLACSAHLVATGSARVRARVLGALLGVVAVAVAVLASGRGPLASVAGPDASPLMVACGAALAALVLVLAAVAARWLRPVLTGAFVLVAVQVAALAVPGTAGPAAALVATPALAAAVAVLAERVRAHRALRVPVAVAGAALLAVPLAAQVATTVPAPAPASLAAWIATGADPDAPVLADPLDRAALLAAGVPAARLLDASAPAPDGAFRLVSLRPGGTVVPCPPATTLASTPHGTGGAPAAVCRVGPPAPDERSSRARVGAQVAENPAVRGGPAVTAALRAGNVDARLLMMLIALSGQHRIVLTDLPAVPLDAAGTPRRQALIATVDGAPAASSAALRTWLRGQRPLLSPSMVDSGSGLLVTYPAPAPPGLLPP